MITVFELILCTLKDRDKLITEINISCVSLVSGAGFHKLQNIWECLPSKENHPIKVGLESNVSLNYNILPESYIDSVIYYY